jgi:hypothetical protein
MTSGHVSFPFLGAYHIHAVKRGPPVDKPPTVLSRWWDAYPTANSSPSFMTAEEIIELKQDPAASTEFAVIDVRRGDHGVCILSLATRALNFLKLEPFCLKGGHVRRSDNWAAQTFYDDLPDFYEKYKDTPRVIFYCSKSNGRGPRCAGWYGFLHDSSGMSFICSKYIGIKITSTLGMIINRRPMSSKEVSKIGSRNMVTTMISLTETDFSSSDDGPRRLTSPRNCKISAVLSTKQSKVPHMLNV